MPNAINNLWTNKKAIPTAVKMYFERIQVYYDDAK